MTIKGGIAKEHSNFILEGRGAKKNTLAIKRDGEGKEKKQPSRNCMGGSTKKAGGRWGFSPPTLAETTKKMPSKRAEKSKNDA